ncbi:MAG: hypothetical protein HYZ46_09615 [Nitrosomonadales bacterium]|nr:hypothetical protein [Nitrosomonadales bacterium]
MWRKVNLFMAWFLIPQTVAMGFVAAIGRVVLELLGATTREGDIPGRMVGALLLFGAVYLVLHFRGSLPPEGKPEGNGFLFGHRLVLAGNVLSSLFILFQFTHPWIESRDVLLVLDKFTDAFGYWTMACWLVGFSFLYQSSLPKKN